MTDEQINRVASALDRALAFEVESDVYAGEMTHEERRAIAKFIIPIIQAEERARIVAWLRDGNAWLNGGECCGSVDSDGICLAPACEWGEQLELLHKVADAIEAQETQP